MSFLKDAPVSEVAMVSVAGAQTCSGKVSAKTVLRQLQEGVASEQIAIVLQVMGDLIKNLDDGVTLLDERRWSAISKPMQALGLEKATSGGGSFRVNPGGPTFACSHTLMPQSHEEFSAGGDLDAFDSVVAGFNASTQQQRKPAVTQPARRGRVLALAGANRFAGSSSSNSNANSNSISHVSSNPNSARLPRFGTISQAAGLAADAMASSMLSDMTSQDSRTAPQKKYEHSSAAAIRAEGIRAAAAALSLTLLRLS
eukprot:TRINITY_DN126854_c0_g1_i1.p2 TRINITY_DN126854_c0_g1~~TRINITY_DN126854_c0_g1_i1.p2  ORF type:complete len:256 (-),score=36.34 TRINITY_DN126854_c0_g1_i1:234-1001(-)